MKKLLVGLLALGSISSFAQQSDLWRCSAVCGYTLYSENIKEPIEADGIGETKAEALKSLFRHKYASQLKCEYKIKNEFECQQIAP